MRRIADYALIGDCRSAALISSDGSVAWLCLPRFSSPSVFGSILDPERGGEFRIAPLEPARISRRYLEGTNVLETTYACESGACRIVDAMPVPAGDPSLRPMREVLRSVEGLRGEVKLGIRVDPRVDYGRKWPRLTKRGTGLWAFTWGGQLLLLQSDAELRPQGQMLSGEHVLKAGECIRFSLGYSEREIGVIAGLGRAAQQRLERTTDWWREWSGRMQYDGPHRAAVMRSALALKLLCSAQSAAVIAAPTTSLPEWPGADRNWDYRYCWLRDAALTMRAFTGLGYLDEGRAFLDWLLHATRLTRPRLQVLYDVYGRTDLPEFELNRWRGFRDSRPVRIGNAASQQLQLDVYGAVCSAALEFVEATGTLRRDEADLLKGFGDEVRRHWQEPDHGIWEIRGRRRHYTFSKIMCWTALNALRRLQAAGHLKLGSAISTTAPAIEDCIESSGYDRSRKSYVGTLGGVEADASLLLAGSLDYRSPSDPHMLGTFEYIHRRLARNGLLYRYEPGSDGIAAPEGAFVICSFFAIDHLARCGEFDAGHRSLRHVLSFANDVGLLSEEIDPDTGELLGNFPQAYAHVGLVHAALRLAAAEAPR